MILCAEIRILVVESLTGAHLLPKQFHFRQRKSQSRNSSSGGGVIVLYFTKSTFKLLGEGGYIIKLYKSIHYQFNK